MKKAGLGSVAAFGAGLLISDLIVDDAHAKSLRRSRADEFNRHVSRAADRKRRRLNKEFIYTIEDLNDFYKEHSMIPPRQGQVWDAVKHRWTKGVERLIEAGRKFRGAADIGRREPTKGTHPAYRFGQTGGGKSHSRKK